MRFIALAAFALLASCSGGARGLVETSEVSKDPQLRTYLNAFSNACLDNAPSFPQALVRSSFENQNAPGALLTATEGKNCRLYVRNYGANSALPTRGDVAEMAARLQSRVGGSSRWVTASMRVAASSGEYTVYAQANAKGDLILSVYK